MYLFRETILLYKLKKKRVDTLELKKKNHFHFHADGDFTRVLSARFLHACRNVTVYVFALCTERVLLLDESYGCVGHAGYKLLAYYCNNVVHAQKASLFSQ